LILDEPTDGLDPNQKYEIAQESIAEWRRKRRSSISTHLLEEVEAVCTRAIIIARGQILLDGPPPNCTCARAITMAVRLGIPLGSEGRIRTELETLPDVAAVEDAEDGEGHALLVIPRT